MATQNINNSTAASAITGSDSIFISKNDTSLQKIDYDLLAKAIIEQYTGSTLAGSAQTLQAAINALNSNRLKIIKQGTFNSDNPIQITVQNSQLYLFVWGLYSSYGVVVLNYGNNINQIVKVDTYVDITVNDGTYEITSSSRTARPYFIVGI